MPRRDAVCAEYEDNVFINCPFDQPFLPVFRAIIFAIHFAGFQARCAQENTDGAASRFEGIKHLIRECRYGIHDISRTEVSDVGGELLPRFNMPLELGVFIGSKEFGDANHQRKKCLILDRKQYRYLAYISDISGQDISYHDDDPVGAIKAVTKWLMDTTMRPIVGGDFVANRYEQFRMALPVMLDVYRLAPDELTFIRYKQLLAEWIRINAT